MKEELPDTVPVDEWWETSFDDHHYTPHGLRKVPADKKEWKCCVCASHRSCYTVCNICFKGLHPECLPKHVCSFDMSETSFEELNGLIKLAEKKESRCCVCTSEGKRRRSKTACSKCNKGLHGECFSKHVCC